MRIPQHTITATERVAVNRPVSLAGPAPSAIGPAGGRLPCPPIFFALALGLSLLATPATGASVKGRVFVDYNGNGMVDAEEPGLAGVAVSDGQKVVLTSESGDYEIDVDDAPFVFVVLPRGYRAAQSFYASANTSDPVDFALIDWPESMQDPIRFVQISDTHIGQGADDVRTFIEDIEEINGLAPKAAFVLATGDLIHIGNRSDQFESYVEGIAHFNPPLFNLPGNHDAREAAGREHYHRYLGPDYFSFNAGNCHFVLLNGMQFGDDVQRAWLQEDLAAAPEGSTLVIATHYLPTETQIKFFAGLGAKAVLSGHWHGNRVERIHGVWDLNTPPLRFGGIDRYPRGFRVVEIKGGEVRNELRLGGFRRHAVVVAPAVGSVAAAKNVPILVNTYDSRVDIASVDCELDGRRVALRKTGPWSWVGEMPVASSAAGEQRLVARIRATNGEAWQTESTFRVQADVTATNRPMAQLRLKWASPTGGFIGISSPLAGAGVVAVGVDDKGDLKNCGVAAFDFEGRKQWRFRTDSGIKNRIAAAKGRLFATSVAGWLYALDEASGELLWKADLDRRRTRWEVAATVVANGVVHVGSQGYVAAFDERTGDKLWDTSLGRKDDWWPSSYTVPAITRGRLLLPNLRYGAYALDARTGEVAWELEGRFTSCAVNEDAAYFLRDGRLTAIAIDSGEVLWTGTEKLDGTTSAPLWAGDRIVVGAADGRVCALSAKDGRLLWSRQTGPSLTSLQPYQRGGSDVNSSPALYRDVVYVGASDGRLYALALADGAELGAYDLGVPIASSPVVVAGTLYIGGYDGNLYAFHVDE